MRVTNPDLAVRAERLGPLPLINHVVRRLGLDDLLAEAVPTTDPRQHVQHAKALGVLLRSVLVERELRLGMKLAGVAELPMYPEERQCHKPTAEQVFRLFSLQARTVLVVAGKDVRSIDPELTDLQRQVLQLMGVPASAYRVRS